MSVNETGVNVRASEPDDVVAIVEIFSGPLAIGGTLQIPYRSTTFRSDQMVNRDDGHHALVAEVSGRVVGTAHLRVERSPRRRHCGSIGMAVHDDYQGRGVGTALMRALIDLADNWLNLHRLELSVYTDNTAGIHLYEKWGFTIEGTAKDFAFRAGRYVDAFNMARVGSDSSRRKGSA
jgi:putative acetyltransferase